MILLGGTFTTISGQPRNKIARLANDGMAQDLTLPDSARVQWTRGGSAPEVALVNFELSTDGGANWSALGAGTRIAGGWERTGLSLPAIGSVRACGRTSGGYGNGAAGIVEQVATYLIADSPEIAVEDLAGNDLANGASVTIPAVLGANASRTFTVRNPGSADLTGLEITIDGPDAAMFTVTASPVAPVSWPNGSTTFTVQFAHTEAGPRTATLHIASNDADENPFNLILNGRDPSANADLADLVLSAGTLTPEFAAAITNYTASVLDDVTSIIVTPTTIDATSAVMVNGTVVASGSASNPIALSAGDNLITVTVTAEDGMTARSYTTVVTRGGFVPGAIDTSFNLAVNGSFIRAAALQPDGKILIVGDFTTVNGAARNELARIDANGALESTATFNPGTGPNGPVYCVAVQADGRILLAGAFTRVNGQPRNGLARLGADGALESTATFNPGTGPDNTIASVIPQTDGKILLAGYFSNVNGQPRNGIARLNADGSVESTATFNPGTGPNGTVWTVALQEDGKILLGGLFTSVNGQHRRIDAHLHRSTPQRRSHTEPQHS